MTLKDILVHVDATGHSEARVALAAELARRHEAHLTGLYAVEPEPSYPLDPVGLAAGAINSTLVAARSRAGERQAQVDFHATVARAGIVGEWRSVDGLAEEVVPAHGRYADLIIVGQSDPDDKIDFDSKVAIQAVLISGRPALVVPYAGHFETTATNIVVAWSDTKEAARALNEALPLLMGADKVTVLAINPPRGGGDDEGSGGATDIARHLARHGVKAEISPSRGA